MTKNYLVVFSKCVGSNFSGHAPDVKGCVSVGDTLSEMTAMMREALVFHLETMFDHGEAVPEAVTENVTFKAEDFEGVEYFVIQKLSVNLPVRQDAKQPGEAHQAA